MTEILLRPAQEVPGLIIERLESRAMGEQALVTSMTIDFSENPVVEALKEHGRPGDICAIDDLGHLWGAALTLEGIQEHREAREEFEERFLGNYIVLGEPSPFERVKGALFDRSHIKAYQVGNRTLSLAGVNCCNSAYEAIDLMADFESEGFNAFLARFIERKGDLRDEQEPGEKFHIAEQSEVLVDYGKKGRSLVQETLLEDLSQEQRAVRMSSSYIPYGRLDKILAAQHGLGAEVNFHTNYPSKFRSPKQSPLERYLLRFSSWRAQTPWVDLRPDKFNHLKAAVIAPVKGPRIAYVASNTFHELPIRAGTAEVALRTTDHELVEQIDSFMIDNLATKPS